MKVRGLHISVLANFCGPIFAYMTDVISVDIGRYNHEDLAMSASCQCNLNTANVSPAHTRKFRSLRMSRPTGKPVPPFRIDAVSRYFIVYSYCVIERWQIFGALMFKVALFGTAYLLEHFLFRLSDNTIHNLTN